MSVKIEKATQDDVDDLSVLFNSYRIFYGQKSNLSLARLFIEQRLINNESVIFYAENENKEKVGFAQLYPSFSSVSVQKIWILNDLYVNESFRGLGIAKNLLSKIHHYAIETKAKGVSLETAHDNYKAKNLYQSLGYIEEKSFQSYFLSLGC